MIQIGNQKYSLEELWKIKKSILLTVISPIKALNLLKIKYSIFRKSPKVIGLPNSLFLEASSYCNLRCPMCLKIQKNSPFDNRNMTLEEYSKIMKELGPTAMTIRFWNYGEPLVNKDIFEMIKIAKYKYKIFTVLSTNGVLLNKEISKKLIESGLDFLVISFDGASKETYEKNRKNGSFENVLKNVEEFMKMKEEMKRKDMLISIQFIIMNTNESEIEKIKKIAQGFKADKLMLRTLNVVSEKGAKLLPTKKEYKTVKEKQVIKKDINFCSNVWEETVINSTGMITACCMDAAIEYPFGNIYTTNFKDIWNGKEYINFRKRILSNIGNIKICSNYCYKKDNKLNFIQ